MNSFLTTDPDAPTAAPVTPTHRLTEEQDFIVHALLSPGDMHKVIAYAGTGKTSTFVAYAAKRPDTSFTYLAFNKSVEREATQRFGQNTLCKTVHALAYGAVGKRFNKIMPSVANWMVAKVLRCPIYEATLVAKTMENYMNSAEDVIGLGHVEPDSLNRLEGDWQMNIVKAATALWTAMQNESHDLNMTHSGYLKLYQLSRPTIPGDIIFLDEAQDTNPVTQALVFSQVEKRKAVLMCGDPYQQIYSWRGAVDAMAAVDCPTSYLTQSFRFGPTVATVANTLLRNYFNEERPLVGMRNEDSPTQVYPTETVICRTNTAIFMTALGYAQTGREYHVIGREVFMEMLDTVMDVYYLWANETSNIVARRIGRFRRYAELVEYATNALDIELTSRAALVSHYTKEIPSLVATLRKHYNSHPSPDTPVLVTCHKAKGLEWDKVRLNDDFPSLYDENGKLRPLSDPTGAKDREALYPEDINLLYVAATRAKKRLIPTASLSRLVRGITDKPLTPTNATE